MFTCLIYIAAGLFTAVSLTAQVKVVKPVSKPRPSSTRLGLYGGVSNSVLLLERNINEDNEAIGIHGGLVYGLSRLWRVSVEHTRYMNIRIEPTWLDVKASTTEINFHTIAKMRRTPLYFYPIFGLSYNVFSGYFTGRRDYLNLFSRFPVNEVVTTRWPGLNTGTGLEYIIRPVSVYGEFKLRIGQSDAHWLNIMDVCLTAGVRYNLRVPTLYRLFKGTRSRYLLDTVEDDF